MNRKRPPEKFSADLLRAGIGGQLLGAKAVDELPATSGAYALIVHLAHAMMPERPRGTKNPLAPGWYVYAGSARGPGGIRARLARHFRAAKRTHWHIDQLTVLNEAEIWASPVPECHECDLVTKLIRSQRFQTPCAGFGSSDCKTCKAHLVLWKG